MATKNFTQFNTATPLTTGDYIVGHNAAGTTEIKTQVRSILNLVEINPIDQINFSSPNNQGSNIFSHPLSSGDGNGYTTLELHPDSSRSSSDQYLIIDPTAPGHIHIRAGGTQDESGAELFLGAEKNYVRVIDNDGIRIQNELVDITNYNFFDSANFSSGTWFTSGGSHYLQLSSIDNNLIGRLNSFTDGSPNYVQFWTTITKLADLTYVPGGTYSQQDNVFTFQVDQGPVSSPQVAYELVFFVYSPIINTLTLQDNEFRIQARDEINIKCTDGSFRLVNDSASTGIHITANNDRVGGGYEWEFGNDSFLYFPDGGALRLKGSAPGTSIGTGGDVAGMIAFDNDYFYRCIGTYDGETNIWKRVQFSASTW